MKEDLVIERIRLWTNTFIEIRQRWLTGEIYYRAYGHLKPALQGGISREEYLELRNIVIEKYVDGKPVYKEVSMESQIIRSPKHGNH